MPDAARKTNNGSVNMRKMIVITALLSGVPLWGAFNAWAQEEAADTTSSMAEQDSAAEQDSTAEAVNPAQEMILETIHIEAVIEKPSVTLIPRKAETDVGDVPFLRRSFEEELKSKPKMLSETIEKLRSTNKVKKSLAKEP